MPDSEHSTRVSWGAPHPDRTGALGNTFVTVLLDDVADLDTLGDAPTAEAIPEAPLPRRIADRYQLRDLLGQGGMGTVWRVWDEELRRTVAMKALRPDLLDERALARFREEAQVAAQLQHPGIIPVHDLGALEDGRVWFTMKEVRGRTLEELLREVHRAWRLGYEATEHGYTFRRLLEAFLRVCETVAYAHARGVVHRDLKPSNIMLGDFGEVLVLDWGLAKVIGAREADAAHERIDLDDSGSHLTRRGTITGTPAYMAPEQAQGRSAEAGPPADVHALGATLYDLLCERPPRLAPNARKLIELVAAGSPFPPPSQQSDATAIDEELDRICLAALAHDPRERYADASELAADLARWLDGARKRERAMTLVEDAEARLQDADRAEAEARALDREAEEALSGVALAAPVADKLAGWTLEDRSRERRAAARSGRTRAVQLLRSALSHAPDLPEAHDRLADIFHRRHAQLEAAGRTDDALAVEADLREHDRTDRYGAYLRGVGAVTLVTDPPGAEVRLHRFVEVERRLQPVFERVLGTTPLVEAPLEMGSYLLTLHRNGHEEVRYPVAVGRQEHWHGVPPEGGDPAPIRLPRVGELGPDEVYVPSGWFWSGDDEFDATLPLRRMWADGFVIGRFPVTVGAYRAWLNALVDAGREEEAQRAEPRLGDSAEPFFARDEQGRYTGIRRDRTGAIWDVLPYSDRAPVVFVTSRQAELFAGWRAEHDDLPWRLPMELEWQKGARGADRRQFPWGSHFEPSWCRMRLTAEALTFVEVDGYPTDVSPYGVRGLAGNVSDWTADPAPPPPAQGDTPRVLVGRYEGPRRIAAGGSCGSGISACSVTARSTIGPGFVAARLGFRLARKFF